MDCQAVHCSKGGCPEKCPQMPGRARHSRTLFLLLLSLYAGKIGNRLKNSFPACITGKKKHLLYADAFFMYVTRFELATFWSVARRSIQLSYTYNYLLFFNSEINNTSVYGFCQHLILKK